MTLRGLAVSSAPCSNHGSHNSVQGPQGTSQPPAGEVGRVKATLAMMYTCGKCETRSMKTFSHQAYKHGVVLVRCPSCQSLHLIADNLGWFGERGWNVERLMAHARNLGTGPASRQSSASHSSEDRSTSNGGVGDKHESTDGPSSSIASSSAPGASSEGDSCPPDQGITDEDMEGYHKVQQLFEATLRSQGAGGQQHNFQPEEVSVMEVSEEDFKAWAAVMKSKQQL
eukprot:CAMPEP_0202359540 /NCGR_PEP_ID=MMETSP1126-20121109/12795_1 /ASSEMBLY_ACC=CAM_ASM_000457 /TAXON_ID=3047 /ORGANISM="Dunaliella tertiolecta, Strain CCMP1320" /LENGTH=226 /DNA_ID=CAMNT_0048952979 /DNA_START=148 /DNA_END=828 /DNA_ORIENTATION=+